MNSSRTEFKYCVEISICIVYLLLSFIDAQRTCVYGLCALTFQLRLPPPIETSNYFN